MHRSVHHPGRGSSARCIAHRAILGFRARSFCSRSGTRSILVSRTRLLDSPRRVEPRRARPLPTIGRHADGLEYIMKIALLVLVGLVVGALGGAALGIGACLAWLQIFRTSGFEDNNGMLVFFTVMPLRDAEIALDQAPAPRRNR